MFFFTKYTWKSTHTWRNLVSSGTFYFVSTQGHSIKLTRGNIWAVPASFVPDIRQCKNIWRRRPVTPPLSRVHILQSAVRWTFGKVDHCLPSVTPWKHGKAETCGDAGPIHTLPSVRSWTRRKARTHSNTLPSIHTLGKVPISSSRLPLIFFAKCFCSTR